jgi:hypothetical protein
VAIYGRIPIKAAESRVPAETLEDIFTSTHRAMSRCWEMRSTQ